MKFSRPKKKFGRPKKYLVYQSGVHVLLVSLFGIPIFLLISNFFGRPKKIWYTKKKFGRPKKYLVYQKKLRPKKWEIDQTIGTQETDQKYMDAAWMFKNIEWDFGNIADILVNKNSIKNR